MKLFTPLLFLVVFISCKKDKHSRYEEQFQISFKLDGHEYKTILAQDELNMYAATGFHSTPTGLIYTLGPNFRLASTDQVSFVFGNFHYLYNDATGNMQRLKQLLGPGNKSYADLNNFDTTLVDAVQINFSDDPQRHSYYSTTIRTVVNGNPGGIIDQPGSQFTITEIKESSTDEANRAAVIIKGTFRCTLYEAFTHTAKQLTDGQFTCIIPML